MRLWGGILIKTTTVFKTISSLLPHNNLRKQHFFKCLVELSSDIWSNFNLVLFGLFVVALFIHKRLMNESVPLIFIGVSRFSISSDSVLVRNM